VLPHGPAPSGLAEHSEERFEVGVPAGTPSPMVRPDRTLQTSRLIIVIWPPYSAAPAN
jgi:hypothetical protein